MPESETPVVEGSILDALMVTPGSPAGLDHRETAGPGKLGRSGKKVNHTAEGELDRSVPRLAAAQELLYAAQSAAVLVVLQGMDAAGKDGTIKHVTSGVNPQGCDVVSFKQPSAEELDHDFLWRAARAVPARGRIGIFNRSHYEDVIVVRVHPALLAAGHVHNGVGPALWKQRYEDINAFEHHLDRNGTQIVKLFLHLSKDEQKRRLLARLDDPSKHWKFSASDLAERQYWDDYQLAYEEALTATSTKWAPWYVVPADDKYVLRALVAGILVRTIEDLHPTVPAVDAAALQQIDAARAQLLAE